MQNTLWKENSISVYEEVRWRKAQIHEHCIDIECTCLLLAVDAFMVLRGYFNTTTIHVERKSSRSLKCLQCGQIELKLKGQNYVVEK